MEVCCARALGCPVLVIVRVVSSLLSIQGGGSGELSTLVQLNCVCVLAWL